MNTRKLLMVVLMLLLAGTLEAQTETYALKGSLKDDTDGSAMIYTNCVLLHAADSTFVCGVTSDDKGVFCFQGIAAGSYLLRISFIGYDTYWQSVSVKSNQNLGVIKLAEVDPYFTVDCGLSTDLFDRRLSLFLNANDIFNTVRTGGESVNPYNPSISESTLTSRYISFGLTWRIGRTEMESQQTHGKKPSGRRNRHQTGQVE